LTSAALGIALAFPAAAQGVADLPSANYTLDPTHSSVTFSVSHLGLSNFTAGFDAVDADLTLDPADPASASLTARIEIRSLDLPAPPDSFVAEMMSANWFDTEAHPEMVFESNAVTLTGETSADIAGTLTLRGVSQPVTLAAIFSKGFPAGIIESHARVGFSATTAINRSDFGMDFGVPAPGTDFGVGDRIDIRIEAEFIEMR
jgi:polyisoprenoid-binding protein YceI